MNIILEFDDLHWKEPENCLPSINRLVSEIPNIKLSFFTVAKHTEIPLHADKKWCKSIQKYIESGNIKLAVHGLTHSHLEFAITDKDIIKTKIQVAELLFNKASLSFTRIFKGPNWGITKEVYDVLDELGYNIVYSHPDKMFTHPRIKIYSYNWNLKDPSPEVSTNLIAHGHTWNICDNGIEQVYTKIVDFIKIYNPTFKFVGEE